MIAEDKCSDSPVFRHRHVLTAHGFYEHDDDADRMTNTLYMIRVLKKQAMSAWCDMFEYNSSRIQDRRNKGSRGMSLNQPESTIIPQTLTARLSHGSA
jgi:hypothetical protein